ncbi:hypothetical protein O181_014594 [Austropuccinia psidii MF-1]|uniref:Uncharacterized protein n=1 Tax=Austropuccinia psidii MF-1 TaxID=1389203 RepID=A0A9Q3GQ02_9BASI|nr:hypothetical protein [Austropuccinia psidii MF-1]
MIGERRASSINQIQTNSRTFQRKAQSTSEGTEMSQEQLRQGLRQSQLAQTLPTRVRDSQIGSFICGQCVQYAQNTYGVYSQGARNNEQELSTQIIDEVGYIQSIISVKFNKIDE